MRKSDLDPLGGFLVDAIVAALDSENLPRDALGVLDGTNAQVTRTASRRVLGFMNETAVHIDYALDRYGSVLDVDVISLNRRLQRSLHGHGKSYGTPLDLVAERALRPGGRSPPANGLRGIEERQQLHRPRDPDAAV